MPNPFDFMCIWILQSSEILPLLILGLVCFAVFSVSRLALIAWQYKRVKNTGELATVMLQGFRVDSIQIGLYWLIPLLLFPLAAFDLTWNTWLAITYVWIIACTLFSIFLEVATPGFISEYDVRPNRLFVEYLKYPKEVFSMLWRGFRWHVFFAIGLTIISAWILSLTMQPILNLDRGWSTLTTLLLWPLMFVLNAAMIRSSLGHRPANPAMFAMTKDAMVNSLILNSAWSVIHAIYSFKHEHKSSDIYGKLAADEVLKIVAQQHHLTFSSHPKYPTLHFAKASSKRNKPLNLVIVLEESLGATFVESLGGIPVTPELEKLKHQGWWFEQMYATGTRSVRGIEAVVSGFPPTPSQSVVKLSKSQRDFFTIAKLLGNQGYHTEFIYGGESHFDNMNGFFRGNGFQSVIDQKDYENPILTGSWGVSDEDLFNKAHQRHLQLHQQSKPFFSLIFSSSNHAPFEFPDGRISLYDEKKATENNAVKYADFALGQFIHQAQQSDYWQDTLFLIVADHDIRVRGEHLVPIKNFHIPALILGADIQAKTIKRICSQIDLPVTLLSLMGIESEHPMIGQDISQLSEQDLLDSQSGRAMMQFNQNYAWMQGNQVVILQSGKSDVYGKYSPISKSLSIVDKATQEYQNLSKVALAHSLLPSQLYQKQQYDIPLQKQT